MSMTENELMLYNTLSGLHLLEKAPKAQVISDLIGIQAQFSMNPKLSLMLRASDYTEDGWDDGLCKIWSHRGTMHVVTEEEAALHLSALAYPREFTDGAWQIPKADADYWSRFIIDEIVSGNRSRAGLKQACLDKGIREALCDRVFYGWGGLIAEMVVRGQIVCGTGTEKEYAVPQKMDLIPRDDARRVMLRRYFEHFGPATAADCRYFFGRWKKPDTDPLLEEILPELEQTKIGGKVYYHKAPLKEGALPDCLFVPGFDQMILGYKERGRMVDEENRGKLTNISGIICPSVLLRGRLRAKWKLGKNVLTITPFEKLLKKDETAVKRRAALCFGKTVAVRFEP